MGLYSSNRLEGISVEETAQYIKEIEETAVDPSFGSVMETVMMMHENDKNMFDSLIECDFISATNENVMNEADAEAANDAGNETKKNKILEKIKEIIAAAGRAMKQAAQNIISKLLDIVKADAKLVGTYEKTLTMANLDGFSGIANFRFPKAAVTADSLKNVKLASEFTSDFNTAVQKAEERDIIDNAWKTFEDKVQNAEEEIKKLGEDDTYFNAKEDSWKPTSDTQIKAMLNSTKNANDTIKEIKNHAATVLAELKKIENAAKSAMKSGKKGKAGETEVYKLTKMYNAASKTVRLFSKEFSAYTNIAVRQVAAYRKATIICGRYALKKSKGEATNEATEAIFNAALAESSDTYVFECFAY